MEWILEQKKLPLKFVWKIARASSSYKNIWQVKLKRDNLIGLGEAAFLTKDEVDLHIQDEFNNLIKKMGQQGDRLFQNPEIFENYILGQEISAPLKFSMVSAFMDYYCQQSHRSIEEIFNLKKPQKIQTSFSIPILETKDIVPYLQKLDLQRFASLKLKVCRETGKENFLELVKNYSGRIRIDGNESWSDPDEFLNFAHILSKYKDRIEFIEQPLPAKLIQEQIYLKKESSFMFIADESITDGLVTSDLAAGFDGVNLKLMKSSGFYRLLQQLKSASEFNMKTMLGCMVETSLSLKYALSFASQFDYFDIDGFLFFENEPHGLLQENAGVIEMKREAGSL